MKNKKIDAIFASVKRFFHFVYNILVILSFIFCVVFYANVCLTFVMGVVNLIYDATTKFLFIYELKRYPLELKNYTAYQLQLSSELLQVKFKQTGDPKKLYQFLNFLGEQSHGIAKTPGSNIRHLTEITESLQEMQRRRIGVMSNLKPTGYYYSARDNSAEYYIYIHIKYYEMLNFMKAAELPIYPQISHCWVEAASAKYAHVFPEYEIYQTSRNVPVEDLYFPEFPDIYQ